jgi:sulfate adenylyltransferase subunit 1 (EFTu-like GTPase family)
MILAADGESTTLKLDDETKIIREGIIVIREQRPKTVLRYRSKRYF